MPQQQFPSFISISVAVKLKIRKAFVYISLCTFSQLLLHSYLKSVKCENFIQMIFITFFQLWLSISSMLRVCLVRWQNWVISIVTPINRIIPAIRYTYSFSIRKFVCHPTNWTVCHLANLQFPRISRTYPHPTVHGKRRLNRVQSRSRPNTRDEWLEIAVRLNGCYYCY